MKISFRRLVSTIAIAQCLAIPITSAESFAAPPSDPTASAPQSATGTASGGMIGSAYSGAASPNYQTAPYFTDSYGNILMNVSVWGNVVHPGQMTVPEGSDITTLISLAGGPAKGANLQKVRLNRTQPDQKGNMTYIVDIDKYSKTGDRSMLLDLQPNDTVIVPEKKSVDIGLILGIIAAGVSIYTIGH